MRGGHELRVHQRFERFEAWCDGVGQWIFADNGVGGLQAVSGDAHDDAFVLVDVYIVYNVFLVFVVQQPSKSYAIVQQSSH